MFLFRAFIAMLACTALFMSQGHAQGREKKFYRNFWNPTYLSQPLSYCLLSGKECGMPVANRFCKLLGYEKADQEIIANNVGLTHYIASRERCKGWECNGFKLIRCVGEMSHRPEEIYYYQFRRFALPRYNHYRIDWCYQDGKECGQKVALSFCRRMGYLRTKSYQKQTGVPATMALGNQKLCFGNACHGFKEISCYR